MAEEIRDEESPSQEGYQIEKRMMVNDEASDRIDSGRISTTGAALAAGRTVNFVKVFFLAALAFGLGLPHQSMMATAIRAGLGGKIPLAFRRRRKRLSAHSNRRA